MFVQHTNYKDLKLKYTEFLSSCKMHAIILYKLLIKGHFSFGIICGSYNDSQSLPLRFWVIAACDKINVERYTNILVYMTCEQHVLIDQTFVLEFCSCQSLGTYYMDVRNIRVSARLEIKN